MDSPISIPRYLPGFAPDGAAASAYGLGADPALDLTDPSSQGPSLLSNESPFETRLVVTCVAFPPLPCILLPYPPIDTEDTGQVDDLTGMTIDTGGSSSDDGGGDELVPQVIFPETTDDDGDSDLDTYTPDQTVEDDYLNSADTTGMLEVGGSSDGAISFDGDHDWFQISLEAGNTYQFNLDGLSLSDPTLTLWDGSGIEWDFNDDYNGLNSQITFTATVSGTYFLDAAAYCDGLTGTYTLSSALSTNGSDDGTTDPAIDDPGEPFADDPSAYDVVGIGDSVSGSLDSPGEQDWFQLVLEAGHTYQFNLDGSSLSDPTLTLRDANGNQLAYNDDFIGLNSQILFTASESGFYFLEAAAYGGGSTGSYVLSTSLLLASASDDVAADSGTSGVVSFGEDTSGWIDYAGDQDWFQIVLEAGNTYSFTLDGLSLSDPTLTLRDSNGEPLAYNDDFNGLNSQIYFTTTESGSYFLDAAAYGGVSTGSYVLNASLSTGQPENEFVIDPYPYEIFTLDEVTCGTIYAYAETKSYQTFLEAGSVYRFHLDGNSLPDPTLTLRDASGNTLAFNDDYNGLNSQITFTAPTSGTYVLDVAAYGNASTGSYVLSASLVSSVNTDAPSDPASTPAFDIPAAPMTAVSEQEPVQVSLEADQTNTPSLNSLLLPSSSLRLRDGSGTGLVPAISA